VAPKFTSLSVQSSPRMVDLMKLDPRNGRYDSINTSGTLGRVRRSAFARCQTGPFPYKLNPLSAADPAPDNTLATF
jgi:hypothetical protein